MVAKRLIASANPDRRGRGAVCEKSHTADRRLRIADGIIGAPKAGATFLDDAVMKTTISRARIRARRMLAVLLSSIAIGSAWADIATPEQRRACTPDVYRLCAGEIPNVRAITYCLRRNRASLSDACRAVFEQ